MSQPSTDRLPPHSVEAEQGLLGCILLDPNVVLPEIIPMLPSGRDVFYDLRHQTLYETILELWDDRTAIDTITVSERLKARGKLQEAGGLPYIASIPDFAPAAAHFRHYVTPLLEKRVQRAILRVCGGCGSAVYDCESTEALLERLEREVLAIRQSASVEGKSLRKACVEVIGEMEEAFESKGAVQGIKTGFPDLDVMLGGLKPQELIVPAGRPGTGKSTLAMNIAENVAIIDRIPVGVFSLEMSMNALIWRSVCSLSRMDSQNIRRGELKDGDFQKLTTSIARISSAPLHIIEQGGLSIRQIHAHARRLTHLHGIKLWIVDYLQLVRADRRCSNRYEEVTLVSNGLKEMAKDLKVPVVALAQIGRDVEKTNRMPRLSDLRDSGQIEQDADVVLFLHREEVDHGGPVIPVTGIVAKQRHGPTGPVNFTFLRQFTRFESAPPPGREPMPSYDND